MKNAKEESVRYISLEMAESEVPAEAGAALGKIKSETGEGLTLEEVMGVLWRETEPILPHDRIGLSFLEKDGLRVSAVYYRTRYSSDEVLLGNNYSAGLSDSSLSTVLQSGKARIINDLEAYLKEKKESGSTKLLVQEGVRSSLTIPLQVDSRAVGFMFFSSRKKGVFRDLHAAFLLDISKTIAQHLEKVWRIFKLEETTSDYLSMLGFVSHEMKSPLASMMTVGSTYLKGYTGKVDPLAEKTMKKMMRISGYLINMVKNYLDLSRLESGEMKFQPEPGINFREEILDFALDTVSARAEERGSEFRVSAPEKEVKITCDRDLMRIVAVNLLDNAVKYGNDNITIDIRYGPSGTDEGGDGKGHGLHFSVRNPGVGFSVEDSRKLFRRFSRLKQKGTEDRRGTGLGLYLTWWIIQKHDGDIWGDSEPGEWAEFSFHI